MLDILGADVTRLHHVEHRARGGSCAEELCQQNEALFLEPSRTTRRAEQTEMLLTDFTERTEGVGKSTRPSSPALLLHTVLVTSVADELSDGPRPRMGRNFLGAERHSDRVIVTSHQHALSAETPRHRILVAVETDLVRTPDADRGQVVGVEVDVAERQSACRFPVTAGANDSSGINGRAQR